MTVDYPFSLAQLARILSALENERRNPNTKRTAIKAIARNAAQIGLSAEDIFDAADGLLSGRMSAAEFRAALRDEGCEPASFMTEAPAEPAPDDAADEPAQAYIMPNAGPLAVAQSGTGDGAATDVAEAAEDAPVAATSVVAANPATTETQLGAKQQLLAACRAAEHWLQAELHRPDETRPDDILRVLRAAIERAEGQRKSRETRQPGQSRHPSRRPRKSSKEAMLIEMLRRPEGATIAQIMAATGWQAHTCRGAFAGALKKKRGLIVNSQKPHRGERVYRIVG
jgi:Protein of unknown function (DUF3489)